MIICSPAAQKFWQVPRGVGRAHNAACAQALGDLLKATHRGYVIPPRPEKSPVEGQRASADFVEARRSALEHYLRQLAAHPVLSRSQARPCRAPCTPLPGSLRSALPGIGWLFVSGETVATPGEEARSDGDETETAAGRQSLRDCHKNALTSASRHSHADRGHAWSFLGFRVMGVLVCGL